jgi:hypothetical protein
VRVWANVGSVRRKVAELALKTTHHVGEEGGVGDGRAHLEQLVDEELQACDILMDRLVLLVEAA